MNKKQYIYNTLTKILYVVMNISQPPKAKVGVYHLKSIINGYPGSIELTGFTKEYVKLEAESAFVAKAMVLERFGPDALVLTQTRHPVVSETIVQFKFPDKLYEKENQGLMAGDIITIHRIDPSRQVTVRDERTVICA